MDKVNVLEEAIQLDYDVLEYVKHYTPLERLAFGILHTALKDFMGLIHTNTLEQGETKQMVKESGEDYIFGDDQDYPLSFESICAGLGIDAENLRDGLRAIVIDPTRYEAFRKTLPIVNYKGKPDSEL